VREEDDDLAGPLHRDRLSHCWPPPDLLLGLQQPVVHQRLNLLLSHRGRLLDGAWIWDHRLLHLALLESGALGSKGH
jgi:hypothetical protein